MHPLATLCIVASHSGGHIIPAITLAEQALNCFQVNKVLCITSDRALDVGIARHHSQEHMVHIPTYIEHPPLRTPWRLPMWLYRTMKSCFIIGNALRTHRPTHIISTGGLSAIPTCIIGQLLGIPYDLYELNATPGRAITFLSRWARTVYCVFSSTQRLLPHAPTQRAPYPIRFSDTDRITAETARDQLNIPTRTPMILILGGSQGAKTLNSLIMGVAKTLTRAYIVHQTGAADYERVAQFYRSHNIPALVVPYYSDMATLYNAAHIVVGRAGSGTVHEALWFGKKIILVPLEGDVQTPHQVDNALAAQKEHPESVTVVRHTDPGCLAKLHGIFASIFTNRTDRF